MKGETHQTGFGYFITCRPEGQTLDELKRHEEDFFEKGTVDEWPRPFHDFTPRCGVEKLKQFLSERLGEEFAKRQVPFAVVGLD